MVPTVYQRAACVACIFVTLLAAPAANAKPRRWYADWKWWAGEFVMGAALAADGRSSCLGYSRGLVDGGLFSNGSRSCGRAAGWLIFEGGIATAAYTAQHKYIIEPGHKYQNFAAYTFLPAVIGSAHAWAAYHNYSILPPR